MANKLNLLLEAERRGILPPEKLELLAEARKRGLVPSHTSEPSQDIGISSSGSSRTKSGFGVTGSG